jgi:hypothetical protein
MARTSLDLQTASVKQLWVVLQRMRRCPRRSPQLAEVEAAYRRAQREEYMQRYQAWRPGQPIPRRPPGSEDLPRVIITPDWSREFEPERLYRWRAKLADANHPELAACDARLKQVQWDMYRERCAFNPYANHRRPSWVVQAQREQRAADKLAHEWRAASAEPKPKPPPKISRREHPADKIRVKAERWAQHAGGIVAYGLVAYHRKDIPYFQRRRVALAPYALPGGDWYAFPWRGDPAATVAPVDEQARTR